MVDKYCTLISMQKCSYSCFQLHYICLNNLLNVYIAYKFWDFQEVHLINKLKTTAGPLSNTQVVASHRGSCIVEY